LLRGTIHDIVEDAKRVEQLGVDGINLLAYRYDGDVPELVRSVAAATPLPLICAGSVDSVERIETLRDLGVWAFTIGTAALDGVFLRGKPLEDQLRVALAAGS
jgi:phosphoribosylformimino-5-aminoimidazole carboxamide ribonucleotide (ProFAR) isomerase